MGAHGGYYVPHEGKWPIVGSIGLFLMLFGFASSLPSHNADGSFGGMTGVMYAGMAIIIVMMFGWFGDVIRESESGTYKSQEDMSFRWGMSWFIFSEVMFFAAFFGALFYARQFSVPWLGGEGNNALTNALLWTGYEGVWPTNGPEAVGGEYDPMPAWGVPAINTAILLTSGATITWAHHALKKNNRGQLILGLLLTVLLGAVFLYLQVHEYMVLYADHNLKLSTGIYGSTFFMLTGFHGFHVFVGATILTIILLRAIKGHFKPENHFAFEAAAWYWHFVDVVWLGLFIFVYVLV